MQKLNSWNISVFILSIITASFLFVNGLYADSKNNGFDPNSVVFVTNRDSSDIAVIDMATDTIIDRIACGEFSNPHMAMATMDGKYLIATGTQDNFVAIIDLETREISKVRLGLMPEHFDVSPDNKYAYIGNMGVGQVSVVDIANKLEVKRIAGFFEPHGPTCLPGGDKVYVSNIGAHEVGVIDAKKQELVKRIEVGSSHVLAMANLPNRLSEIIGIANPTLTPDGRYAYAADGDSNQVAVIDTVTDNVIATIPVGAQPWRAYSSPDGKMMLVPNNGDQTISVIDTKKNKVIATFPGGEDMTGINFVNNGKKAYVISRAESSVYVINLEKMKEQSRIKLGEDLDLETASTTSDGKKVYLASSRSNSVFVFDGNTDNYKKIANVGVSPWAVTIIGGQNYCH